jgi:hypothetical protein
MDFTPRSVVTFYVADGTDLVPGANPTPLKGATITVMQGETPIETVVSDTSGIAEMVVANGDYTYAVSRPGYADLTGSFTVDNADQTVYVNMTGMDKLTASPVRLYPNPVESKLIIERNNSDKVIIELYSISGILIGTMKTENATTTVDVGALSSGSYFIRIVGIDTAPTVHRFIKR